MGPSALDKRWSLKGRKILMEFTHLTGTGWWWKRCHGFSPLLPPPPKNDAVVIYGIKLAAVYPCVNAFHKMLLSSEGSRVSSQKGPFIARSISIRERGANMFQSELLVLWKIQEYKQSHDWNVRRWGVAKKRQSRQENRKNFPKIDDLVTI